MQNLISVNYSVIYVDHLLFYILISLSAFESTDHREILNFFISSTAVFLKYRTAV